MEANKSVILFDGQCNLCSWSVRFIIRGDPGGRFRFASLQAPAGRRLLAEHGIDSHALDSVILIENGVWHGESAAALRIVRRMAWPWPLFYALVAVPRPLRDWVYRLIARNRFRWFGRPESCLVPTPELQERFLA